MKWYWLLEPLKGRLKISSTVWLERDRYVQLFLKNSALITNCTVDKRDSLIIFETRFIYFSKSKTKLVPVFNLVY